MPGRIPVQQLRTGVLVGTTIRPRNGTAAFYPRVNTGSRITVYAAEPLGAGGWVVGISISPDGNTRLVRTDTLGAWRWDTAANQWVACITGSSIPSPYNAMDSGEGVQAIVAANSIAYMAYNNAVFKSTDGGHTWSLSLTGVDTRPNGPTARHWESHMAVDPADSQKCIYGSINAGLWFTLNGGTSWTQVASGTLPFGIDGADPPADTTDGIPCVDIDGSGNWWAAPYGSGLWRSTNSGTSWTKISSDSDFVGVHGLKHGDNGDIMVTASATLAEAAADARVFRYRSGAWADLTPAGTQRSWRSLAYDPLTSGRVMVQADGGYKRISLDYGTTWTASNVPNHTFTSAAPDVTWLANANGATTGQTFFTTIAGLQFDPVVSGRVWMSQGIGVWYADLPALTTDPLTWVAASRGIEQLVVNDVIVPPGGPPLSLSWDRPIFLPGEYS